MSFKLKDVISLVALGILLYVSVIYNEAYSEISNILAAEEQDDKYYSSEQKPRIKKTDEKYDPSSSLRSKINQDDTETRDEDKTNTNEQKKKPLPAFFDVFGDVNEPFDAKQNGDIPFFWHINRAGGSTIKDILGGCLGLVQASNVGVLQGHDADVMLKVVRISAAKYLNVDTTSLDGIKRAKQLGITTSGLMDVVVSNRFVAVGEQLFTLDHRAKLFVMMRDPIERAVSIFYYISTAKWEKTYDPNLGIYELEDYAKTNRIENNWMVRSLVNKMNGFLTLQDLELAKEILRTKCLIGVLSKKQESLKRFEAYFGWSKVAKKPGVAECQERLIGWGWSNKNKHPELNFQSQAYELIRTKNELDIKLYQYALELFEEQGDDIDFDALREASELEKEQNEDEEGEAVNEQYGKEFYNNIDNAK